jgi:omega-6 fatty acid desaturase (delta-12 desaturase)
MRTEREIIDATRPFAKEDRVRSWAHVATSFALLASVASIALVARSPLVRVAASLVEGLAIVRAFILLHDFLHGAILRGSRLARAIFWAFGLAVLTPPPVWRESHNYHHAHNGKLVGSHLGSFPIVTPAMWARMSPARRLAYRIARHPATMLLGYLTVFGWGMCLSPLAKAPRKNASAALALAAQPMLAWMVVRTLGWSSWISGVFAPLWLAMAIGSYLFYAQHNFPGARFQPRQSWSYVRAALESSSFMPMGPVMRFFTGNIGFHHVHHLNASIPFYRLPDAMAAVPELQHPATTTLAPSDVVSCLRLDVWDPSRGEMAALDAYPPSPSPASTPPS